MKQALSLVCDSRKHSAYSAEQASSLDSVTILHAFFRCSSPAQMTSSAILGWGSLFHHFDPEIKATVSWAPRSHLDMCRWLLLGLPWARLQEDNALDL